MNQSEELTAFYIDYKNWLDNGSPQDKPYTRAYGLCSNAGRWCKNHNLEHLVLFNEMERQFKLARLDTGYPFGSVKYNREGDTFTQHLNPDRIKWVNDHASQTP